MRRPLGDVRIIAIEQYAAGPWGSMHLADLGAEVIKVERPAGGGDIGRYVPPFQRGEDSLFFETFNQNKRSLGINLSSDAGQRIFHDLVRVSDAVYSNVRGDVPGGLGFTYGDLRHINPSVVCCSLSSFGMDSSEASSPGYDYIVQGRAGWMSITGEPESPPTKTGLSLVDFSGGFVAALSLMVGLHAARRDGIGMDCDVSLFDTALGLLTYPATWHLTAGFEPERTRHSAHPSIVPFQNFETADGWIVVGCAKEGFWRRLVACLDDDTLRESRFDTFATRAEYSGELLSILAGHFRSDDSSAWLRRLSAFGVPSGPVNTIPEALDDPLVAERQLLRESWHPDFGTVRSVASPVRVGDRPSGNRRAPRRGEDDHYVLGEILGYSDREVHALRAGSAFS